jgi:hypothetical protein
MRSKYFLLLIKRELTLLVLLLLWMFLVLSGCSQTEYPKDLPRLYAGTITITQQNVPLANASVFLTPTDGSQWNAGGTTNTNGKAILYTHGRYKGVVAGTYKVTIDKYEIGHEKPNAETIYAKTGNYPVPDAYSFVELQYTDSNKTPLEIIISEKNQSFSFDVGPSVRVLLPH